jgi:ClpP class serine protease
MSGGTLICLAANEIVMSPHAVVGPIDPQLGQYPAASLIKAAERKPIERVEDRTLILADVGRKAIEQIRVAARELLEGRLPSEKAHELACKLSEGTWTHDYPISAGEAKAMGLNVSTDIPNDIMDFLSLYPQPTRAQEGGIEYLPIPRERPADRRERP